MNNNRIKLSIDFLLAVLVAFCLATISHSQFVLLELSKVGAEINFVTRVSASFSDLLGLLPTYAPVIAIGMLISLPFATWLRSKFSSSFRGWYPIAGGATMLAIHAAMYPILEITLIAGARSVLGLLMQVTAGVIGGWVFYQLRTRSLSQTK